jgi:pseudaminic acid cytidylyltransferase
MRVAIIPARGGSKRIPRKNIKSFNGHPMISWSIKSAIDSKCFDWVIVSTDDDEIAEISKFYGASVPFMRPMELSDDFVGTSDVVAHSVNWISNNIGQVTYACCIYATAPFLRPDDLRLGFEIMLTSGAEYAFSVTSFSFPIQRAIKITPSKRVKMFDSKFENFRSQDLEDAWHDAGQFYWGRANAWLSKLSLFGNFSAPVILPRYRVQDIDTLEDWHFAELMLNSLNQRI